MKQVIIFCFLFFMGISSVSVEAANQMKPSVTAVDNILKSLKRNNLAQVEKDFSSLKKEWFKIKSDIRKNSLETHTKIETKIAIISLAILNEDTAKAEEALQSLKIIMNTEQPEKESSCSDSELSAITEPNFDAEQPEKKSSLGVYVGLLQETKKSLEAKDFPKMKAQTEQITEQWFSIEGDIVSQSKEAYNNSERNLVLLASYVEQENVEKANEVLIQLINNLQPYVNSSYTMWDAALIPIREGLEALLVLGALLSFTKKSNNKKGTYWIWGGTIAGVLGSIGVGVLVTYVLSSAAFGKNNFLINGLSGVFASSMLLYMSYWLHRNANMQEWSSFINEKTKVAVSSGAFFSLALLAFLAVLREGIETVVFLVGMVNQMETSELLLGILLGFVVLAIVGVAMIFLSVRVPLKPFFLVSSAIVLYLCIKFMGSGIHSLQLAGYIPTTSAPVIPSIDLFGVYPSWYSTMPQLIIVMIAICVVVVKKIKKSQGAL